MNTNETSAPRHVSANVVREIAGGISDMTLWRWIRDPALNFPQPVYIGRRRFWRESDVADWLASRPVAVCDSRAA